MAELVPVHSLVRLLQLVSPSLPVGAFAYSQGLEWAVEAAWVQDAVDLEDWLAGLLEGPFSHLDIPLLTRLRVALEADDEAAVSHWNGLLLAHRETAELRAEERCRGRALASLLVSLELPGARRWQSSLEACSLAGFALATLAWEIGLEAAAQGLAWSWLENQVLAAVKIVPLGQTDGQRVLLRLGAWIGPAVSRGLALGDDELGGSAPALALASSLHERQYTRLYRS